MEWKKALIVEEGHEDLSMLQETLRKKGYRAHFVETAPQALAYVAEHKVDLILTREAVGGDKDGGAILLTQLREKGVTAPAILYGTPAGAEKLEMVPERNAFVADDIKDRALSERVAKIIDGFSVTQPRENWSEQISEGALVSAARSVP